MRFQIFIWIFLVSGSIFGKTTYINADKLPVSKENETNFRFLREHEKYVDHWSPTWNYSVSKVTIAEGLRNALNFYSKQEASNLEVTLLLGDISSYLYHLNEPGSFDSAVGYYKNAARIDPLDFRSFWFLANLYASSNDLNSAISRFRMAQSRLPKSEPYEFWEQFASAAKTAKMPTTCIFAMDKAKALLGRSSDYEKSYGSNVRSRMVEVYGNRSYTNKELWTYTEDGIVSFLSRPLGIRIDIDPEWELDASGFSNKSAIFKVIPFAETGSDGREVKFSITITARLATEDEDLRGYLNGLVGSGSAKEEFDFSNKYNNMVSYQILDPEKDKERGGTHWCVLGVKRKQPLYLGLSLERPVALPEKDSGESESSGFEPTYNRFGGTIFYAVVLETCEEIYPAAKQVLWDLFVNHLTLE